MKWPKLFDRLRPVGFDETVVVLDLETSGLDPRTDEILSLAAVRVRGSLIELHDRVSVRFRAGSVVKAESIRHHRLRPQDLHDGAELSAFLPEFLGWLGNDPVVGYAIAFDVAFLRRDCKALGLAFSPRTSDVREIYAARMQRRHPERTPDLKFEAICQAAGVTPMGRHDALGDAVTTALVWIALGLGKP